MQKQIINATVLAGLALFGALHTHGATSYMATEAFVRNAVSNEASRVDTMVAAPYSAQAIYAEGDHCIYTGVLYRCKSTKLPGKWDSFYWTPTTLDAVKVDAVAKSTLTGLERYSDISTFGAIRWVYDTSVSGGQLSVSNILCGLSATVQNGSATTVFNDSWGMEVFPNPDKWHYGVRMTERGGSQRESLLTIYIDNSKVEFETLTETIDRETSGIAKSVAAVASLTNSLIDATNNLAATKVDADKKPVLSGEKSITPEQMFGKIQWSYDTIVPGGSLTVKSLKYTDLVVTVTNGESGVVSNSACRLSVFPRQGKRHYYVDMEDISASLLARIQLDIEDEYETLDESIARGIDNAGWTSFERKSLDGISQGFLISYTNSETITSLKGSGSYKTLNETVEFCKGQPFVAQDLVTYYLNLIETNDWSELEFEYGWNVLDITFNNVTFMVDSGDAPYGQFAQGTITGDGASRSLVIEGITPISSKVEFGISFRHTTDYNPMSWAIRATGTGINSSGIYCAFSWSKNQGQAAELQVVPLVNSNINQIGEGFLVSTTNSESYFEISGYAFDKSFLEVADFLKAHNNPYTKSINTMIDGTLTNSCPLSIIDRSVGIVSFSCTVTIAGSDSRILTLKIENQDTPPPPSYLPVPGVELGNGYYQESATALMFEYTSSTNLDWGFTSVFVGAGRDSSGVVGDVQMVATYSSGAGTTNLTFQPLVSISKLGYADVASLCDNGKLAPGCQYQITNYVATTTQSGTQSAHHPFDIIVTAISTNALSEEAKATLHAGDTYFPGGNCNLAEWKVWYSINNDTKRFAWADSTNGKGVIYRMIDEYGNDVPYDFKGIQFKKKIPFYDTSGVATQTNNVWCYTFDGGWSQQGARRQMDFSIDDAGYSNFIFGNKIRPYIVEVTSGGYYLQQKLNGIVSLGYNVEENSFDEGCNDIILGQKNSSSANVIKNDFGKGCFANEFGAFFIGNEVKSYVNRCRYVFTGNPSAEAPRTSLNTIGVACSGIVLSRFNTLNTIENGCVDITFADSVRDVNIANGSKRITIGHDSSGIKIGAYVEDVNLGFACYGLEIGTYAQFVNIGNSANGLWQYITIAPGVHYLDITKSGLNNYGQNISVQSGTYGTASNHGTITVEVNTPYHVEYRPQNSKVLEVPVP